MWNFFIHRGVKKDTPESATNSGSRPKRRRRMPFAGAEPLETRALLSATGNDSPMESFSMIDLTNSLPPVPADIALSEVENLKASFAGADANWNHRTGQPLVNHLGEADFSSDLSDSLFASIAQGPPIRFAPAEDHGGFNIFSLHSRPHDSEPKVELRVAETGQLISVGSASSVQDSNGLTINDDSSPMTYLRATDSEGRVHSQLAFVTRTTRSAAVTEPQSSINSDGVVVVDAEVSDESISEELATRPDLHDLETALDAASQSASPNSPREGAPQSLAAASRTRWVTPTRVAGANDQEHRAASDARREAASGRLISRGATDDKLDSDSDESSAMPIFDPTTRNVVVSVCLLGSLARATARRRRRLKAAIAP